MARTQGLETILVAVVVTLGTVGTAFADGEKIVSFDESNGEYSEGIAVNRRGDLFVSVGLLGQVRKIPAGSTTPQVFGVIPGFVGNPLTFDFGVLGLTVDAAGNVYAAVQSLTNDAARGVWKFDRKSGAASKFLGTEVIEWPNDLVFDESGNLYITDSRKGAVWRMSPQGELVNWLESDLLLGTGLVGLMVGANGIAYFEDVIYVSVTEQQTVVEVQIQDGGVAGLPTVIANFAGAYPNTNPLPSITDGLAMDVLGNIWVADPGGQAIVMINTDGTIEVVASGDPLDYPATIAFGSGAAGVQKVYAANFSVGELFGDPTPRAGPGVVVLNVEIPGQPLAY